MKFLGLLLALLAGLFILSRVTGIPANSPFAFIPNNRDPVPTNFPLGQPTTTNFPQPYPETHQGAAWKELRIHGWSRTILLNYPEEWIEYKNIVKERGDYGNIVGTGTVSSFQPESIPAETFPEGQAQVQVLVETGGTYVTFESVLKCEDDLIQTCDTISIGDTPFQRAVYRDQNGQELILLSTVKGNVVITLKGLIHNQASERTRETVSRILGSFRFLN